MVFIYDDFDVDEYDLVEYGDKGNVVGCFLVGFINYIVDFFGLDFENFVLWFVFLNLVLFLLNIEMNLRLLILKSLRFDLEFLGINIFLLDS